MNSNNFNIIATVVQGHTFTISSRYQPGKILGRGSFGVVCTAFDTLEQKNVAIKRIRPFANDEWDARHTLREIRLMKLLGKHPNVITLYGLSIFEEKSELYMVMELMDCDLHRIIQSKQPLNDMHYKCFAKQMLEGIRAMHEIGVFHRDLKPGNILVSKDCQLRITDFGLARFIDKVTLSGNNRQNPLTEYVVTRWYRCPELLLSPNLPYSAAIDIWSIGCIIGELIKRKPLFPGKSHANQVQLVLEVRGYTDPSSFGFELSSEAASFLDRKCRYAGKSLSSFIPQASAEALELLETLLDLNPKRRPSAARCLQYSYLRDAQVLCDYNSNVMPRKVDEKYFDFERVEYSLEALQNMVREEVNKPCDDSIFFSDDKQLSPSLTNSQQLLERKTLSKNIIRDSPNNKSQKHLISSSSSSSNTNINNNNNNNNNSSTMTGGSSILASASDVYSTENDEAIQYYQQQQQQYHNNNNNNNNKNYTPARETIDRSDSTQTIPAGLQSNSKMNRSKSAPPSPSPQKMEMITKQEKKHKRRFFLQGLQKLRQDNNNEQQQTNVNSARSDRQVMSGVTNDELTTRRDIIQPSGILRSGIQHLTSTGSGNIHPITNTSTSLRSTSNKYNYSTSTTNTTNTNESNDLTPHLNSQFQNLGVSYGGYHTNNNYNEPVATIPVRKLSSAPPVEARITRLPALQQKLLPIRSNNNNNNNNTNNNNSYR